jgi:hypothetical protein
LLLVGVLVSVLVSVSVGGLLGVLVGILLGEKVGCIEGDKDELPVKLVICKLRIFFIKK